MRYNNIFDTIGKTPVVELKRYSPSRSVRIFAKLEGVNPAGSVKDRVALFMMLNAQKQGVLSKDKEIIEATSGNTGIGLAMASAVMGYRFVAVMQKGVSKERVALLRAYGAKVVIVGGPGNARNNTAIEYVRSVAMEKPEKYVMLDQYRNLHNVIAHYMTTGQEIAKQIPNVTHFVSGIGTGGTIMGVGKRLKELNAQIKIVGVEPSKDVSIVGLRNMDKYTPEIINFGMIDRIIKINNSEQSYELARDILRHEGISAGLSSGASLWGAIEVAKSIRRGVVVTLFADRAERYLSTKVYD